MGIVNTEWVLWMGIVDVLTVNNSTLYLSERAIALFTRLGEQLALFVRDPVLSTVLSKPGEEGHKIWSHVLKITMMAFRNARLLKVR